MLALVGCSSAPSHNSSAFVEEIVRHADSHRGELLSSDGELLLIRPDGAGWILRIATRNYRHVFDVRFPQEPSEFRLGQDVTFLGSLQGTRPLREAYSGEIIIVDGFALKPLGAKPSFAPGKEALAESWLKGTLDLTARRADASPALPQAVDTPRPIAPAVPAAPPRPAVAADELDRGAPSPDVAQMLHAWSQLTEADRADFLRRAAQSR